MRVNDQVAVGAEIECVGADRADRRRERAGRVMHEIVGRHVERCGVQRASVGIANFGINGDHAGGGEVEGAVDRHGAIDDGDRSPWPGRRSGRLRLISEIQRSEGHVAIFDDEAAATLHQADAEGRTASAG